jgi:hypothetical protein
MRVFVYIVMGIVGLALVAGAIILLVVAVLAIVDLLT